jgi:hypothetical protein
MRRMLNPIEDSLWVAEQPHRYLGVALTTHMTIIRLVGGVLMVHSPIHLTQELLFGTASIGKVRFIVAPNRFHHLFVRDWQRAYPNAQTFCAPGLDTKRGDLNFTATLGDDPPAAWADEVDQAFMRAFPPLNEIVFFHRQTRTVIFTDLLFNIAMIPHMLDLCCASMVRSAGPRYHAPSSCCCAAGAGSALNSSRGFCPGI